MRVLVAYMQQRGGGGSNNSTRATVAAMAAAGVEMEVFTRSSRDLPVTFWGRVQAGTSALHAPGSEREFTRLLDTFRPDLVHAYELFPLLSPRILAECTRRGIPVVMSSDDYRLTCPVRTHLREDRVCTECVGGREYRAILHNCRDNMAESVVMSTYAAMVRMRGLVADHVTTYISPSEFGARWLVEKAGIPGPRVKVLPPIVDTPPVAADASRGRYVGFSGRIVPEKGVETFKEAAKITGLPFVLTRNQAWATTAELSHGLETVITGDRAGLEAFYREARIIVLPSLWFETFGLSVAEAMSHGIPVIASRIGALAELVDDGVNGLLFEPGDANDLAAKVRLLWSDAELGRRLGAAARAKSARWVTRLHVELLGSIYAEALANPIGKAAA